MIPDTTDPGIVKDFLWGMYQEHCNQGRHHETQRTAVTNIVLAVAAVLLGIITLDKAVDRADLLMAGALVFVGLFGAAFTTKHYERFSLHMERARNFRDALDRAFMGSALKSLKVKADTEHERNFPTLKAWHEGKWRLHQMWLALHMIVAILSVLLILVALYHPIKTPGDLSRLDGGSLRSWKLATLP